MNSVASTGYKPQPEFTLGTTGHEANSSGVSWAAVLAGAFVCSALSLSLLSLGVGLGFSAISPWAGEGASAATMGVASIVWLIAMQIIAAATGGYVAGRLRTKWASVHSDEVYFRDTAHGFLVWAVGLVVTAGLLGSAASTLIGSLSRMGSAAAVSAMVVSGNNSKSRNSKVGDSTGQGDAAEYFVDSLFRTEQFGVATDNRDAKAESLRILSHSLTDMSVDDKVYLTKLVAAKTGVPPSEAAKRINEMQAQFKVKEAELKQAADTARKIAMGTSLWMFLGLLTGAFCASFAATLGGRQRDNVQMN